MSYTLLQLTEPVARKAHRCIWCGQTIQEGARHLHERSVFDGQIQVHRWHFECLSAAQEQWRQDPLDDTFTAYRHERPTVSEPER